MGSFGQPAGVLAYGFCTTVAMNLDKIAPSRCTLSWEEIFVVWVNFNLGLIMHVDTIISSLFFPVICCGLTSVPLVSAEYS